MENKQVELFLEKIIKGFVFYLFIVFVSTELFSVFNLISRFLVIMVHVCFLIFAFLKLKKNKRSFKIFWVKFRNNHFCWILTVLLLLLFYIAVFYPPNTWDSMTYHMSRVAHWIENKNVNFYSTPIDRQLYSNPLAEYVVMNWYLLCNSDILVNLVQWVAIGLSGVLSYLLVGVLKGDSKGKILAVFLVLTTPMAILQSTGTQNDLVVSFLLLSMIFFGFKENKCFFGLSLALGMLTKNTFIVFAVPFLIYFVLVWFKKYGVKRVFNWCCYFLICTVTVNSMHWYRNYVFFNSIFGSKDMIVFFRVADPGLIPLVSNVIKYTLMHFSLPFLNYENFLYKLAVLSHSILGIDLNNPALNFLDTKYDMSTFFINEGYSGNFLLTLLIIITFIFFIFFKKKKNKGYFFSVLLGGLFFSFLFRWQPWGSRLMLPWFLASIPMVVAILFHKFFKNETRLKVFILILLIVSAPYYFGSCRFGFSSLNYCYPSNRQIFPKPLIEDGSYFKRYFFSNIWIYPHFMQVASLVNKETDNLALLISGDNYEYPWWVYLKNKNMKTKIMVEIRLIQSTQPKGKTLFIIENDSLKNKNISYSDKLILILDTGYYKVYYLDNR